MFQSWTTSLFQQSLSAASPSGVRAQVSGFLIRLEIFLKRAAGSATVTPKRGSQRRQAGAAGVDVIVTDPDDGSDWWSLNYKKAGREGDDKFQTGTWNSAKTFKARNLAASGEGGAFVEWPRWNFNFFSNLMLRCQRRGGPCCLRCWESSTHGGRWGGTAGGSTVTPPTGHFGLSAERSMSHKFTLSFFFFAPGNHSRNRGEGGWRWKQIFWAENQVCIHRSAGRMNPKYSERRVMEEKATFIAPDTQEVWSTAQLHSESTVKLQQPELI